MSYHPASFVLGGESIDLRSHIKLTLAFLKTKQYLTNFVRDPQFSDKIKTAFGTDLAAQTALVLCQKLLNSNGRLIPSFQILTSEQLQGANGAFSEITNTIYIAQDFIQENNIKAIASLLLEEIGHKIDSILNETDSPGDEGEIFSALVRGKKLSSEELEQLYQENDWGTIVLNGRTIAVEKQDFTGTSDNDTIHGTSNNDRIWGLDGSDLLKGKQGNDSILGGFGDDYLYGEAGNDTLNGESGDDAIDAGTGIDSISGGDQIYADFLYLNLSSETSNLIINYTDPNNGTISNGTVFNGIEQISLTTGSGNDTINLSAATFSGAFVPTFANFVYAGAGDDVMTGGIGNDSLEGEEGSDVIRGDEGHDLILGGFGDDYLYGEGGNDTLDGGSGDDNLYPGTGIDSISGGEQIYADYLYLDLSSETSNLIVNYTAPNNGTVSNGTIFNGIEQLQVITGSGHDSVNVSGSTFTGFPLSTFTNLINAGAGNDSITGSLARDELAGEAGNDTIAGGEGDDFFYPGTGVDSIIGGTGNDRLILDFTTATTPITVTYTHTNHGTISNGTKFKEVESINLQTGSGNDNINVSAVSFSGYYDFDFYTTRIFAGAGNDKITTGSSDDLLYGEAGNDNLNGGTGYDTMCGGIGNDTYTVDTFWDVIIENDSEGTDIVKTTFDYTLGEHLENLILMGTSAISGAGNSINNALLGNSNDNTLTGDGGNDTLVGHGGNDTLVGGTGNDTLTGSAGLDQFTFNTPTEGIDRLRDFDITDDTIAVSATGFGGGLIAGLRISPSQFCIGVAATTAEQRFIYNNTTGALCFDLDGSGTTTAIQFATLSQNLAMTNADIFVLT